MEVDQDEQNRERSPDPAEDIDALTRRTCDVFHVNFLSTSNQPQALTKLRRTIEGRLDDSSALSDSTKHTVKIKLLEGIKRTQFDSVSIKLSVYMEERNSNVSEDEYARNSPNSVSTKRPVCQCLFTSCDSTGRGTRFLNRTGRESVQNLPVFLWHGPAALWSILKPILESTLKCNFCRVTFSKVDLEILAGVWCMEELQRNALTDTQKLRIVYELNKGGTEFTCVQSLKPWKDRLNELSDSSRTRVSLQRGLRRLWNEVYDSYQNTSGINLAAFLFKKIATKHCVASADGKIKLRSESSMEEIANVISHLTYIVERS